VPRAGLTAAHVSIAPHSLSASQRLQTVTLPRGRVPQVFVAGLQLLAPQSIASVATVHGLHVLLTHRGLPVMWLQSPSPMQAPQVFALVSHRLALAVAQSVFASH